MAEVSLSNTGCNISLICDHPSSFARRDTLFYGAPTVRANDSFTVTCTVSSGACPPAGTWLNLYGNLPSTASTPANAFASSGAGWKGSEGGWKGLDGGNGAMAGARKLVPKSVVNSFGSLFDDETYSDVEFWLPTRRRRGRKSRVRGESERQDLSRELATQVKEQEFTTTNTTTTAVVPFTSPIITSGTALTTSLSNDTEMLSVTSPSNTSEPIPTEQAMATEQPEVSTPRAPPADPYYRKIWANKKILRRGEFFSDLLFGGFAEGNDPPVGSSQPRCSPLLTLILDSPALNHLGRTRTCSDGMIRILTKKCRPTAKMRTFPGDLLQDSLRTMDRARPRSSSGMRLTIPGKH